MANKAAWLWQQPSGGGGVAAEVWQHGNSGILVAAVVAWQCQWW